MSTSPVNLPILSLDDLLIYGQKTILRRFLADDIDRQYLSWLNDPVVVRYSNQRFSAHTKTMADHHLQSFQNSTNLFLMISIKEELKKIGTMTAYIHLEHQTADLGILIGEKQIWGKGYGLDAWITVIDWLFKEIHLRKVTAGTLACNIGMLNIMKRSGMDLECVRYRQEIVDGHEVDQHYYAIFRDAWLEGICLGKCQC